MPKPRETMIAHLQGREKLLEVVGFPRQQAEWITLVCLHSGLFTRDQLAFYLKGANRFYVRRCVKALLDCRVSSRPFADERVADGRLICRIFGKQIYRELEIPHSRHRRETSLEVTRRRLLSLDFVLDHLELPWLPTEKEKVSCFEQLGIGRDLLPRDGSTVTPRGATCQFASVPSRRECFASRHLWRCWPVDQPLIDRPGTTRATLLTLRIHRNRTICRVQGSRVRGVLLIAAQAGFLSPGTPCVEK